MKGRRTDMKSNVRKKLSEYFLYFMLYSIIGWIYEVFLEVVVYRWGFSNRGVLFGPYCIVYGTGALILILCLGKLREKRITIGKISVTPLLVFIGIIFITTAIELAAFNFEGRIALNPSIRVGIGGMVFLYLLQPLFKKLTAKMSDKTLYTVSLVLFILLIADMIGTFCL